MENNTLLGVLGALGDHQTMHLIVLRRFQNLFASILVTYGIKSG
jgi:hypothetical protein